MRINKTAIRKLVMQTAWRSGASAISAPFLRGVGAMFMLHRIGKPQNRSGLNAFLSCAPSFLDQLFDTLRAQGWHFVSLDEAVDRLRAGHQDERFAAVTLDDGYRDNADQGAPVFNAHNVPYTIFVCPGLVEGVAFLWWEIVAGIIERSDQVRFATADGAIVERCATAAQKQAAYDRITTYLTTEVSEDEQRRLVAAFAAENGIDPIAHCRAEIMDWAMLGALAKNPLCTIGAHTIHHFNLRRLEDARALEEMTGSADRIAEQLGDRPRHFAFPYGGPDAAGARDVDLAARAGFVSAVTTRHGMLHPAHAAHLCALPRISLNGDYQRAPYVQTMLSGITVPLANRGRNFVTV